MSRGETFIEFARPFAALEDGRIDARIEIEQQPLELEAPVAARIGKHVRHNCALRVSTALTRFVLLPDHRSFCQTS
jgi:hypothetical protein